ncbi:MAG TPA: hypothetical protein VLK30_02715 [Candidatus Limnocylindrales bacterium]|nr:hypothetical protein [Candidatus Limnocylindrales bacterium]
MAYLVAGPLVALIGIAAVFFVLRRKSVEKRSMYSARREQIEHKVRAARQRTLTPHGHVDRPAEPVPAAASPFAPTQVQRAATYEAPVYQPPPAAPPPPPAVQPQQPAEPPPWEQPSIPPSTPGYPAAQPEPFAPAPVEPFRPAPEPTPMPAPSEPVWTPAPRPAEPLPPGETIAPAAASSVAASTTSVGGWSIVNTTKDSSVSAEAEPKKKKKRDKGAPAAGADWQLASGEAPGMDEEQDLKRPSGTVMAIAQYAVLVVGLVMVLIGVLVMVANSHVT